LPPPDSPIVHTSSYNFVPLLAVTTHRQRSRLIGEGTPDLR
jgi:hypothetical protein